MEAVLCECCMCVCCVCAMCVPLRLPWRAPRSCAQSWLTHWGVRSWCAGPACLDPTAGQHTPVSVTCVDQAVNRPRRQAVSTETGATVQQHAQLPGACVSNAQRNACRPDVLTSCYQCHEAEHSTVSPNLFCRCCAWRVPAAQTP